ncbi:MAG: hypothetical protein KF812_03360, partial [Fimbriimonadaceae bacterium]|nr:hypothetical protein [Fimbriimonadaceae bacterium]
VRAEAIPGADPRFMKLKLITDAGHSIAFVDGRRLGRIWIGESPERDRRVSALGPDAHEALPPVTELFQQLRRRRTPIKALLLNQKFLAGIGNWLADEILLKALIAPARLASSLDETEAMALHQSIKDVVTHAVNVDADYQQFPDDWLFHVRWGGGRGDEMWRGHRIQRDTIGGRTTAWIPDLQH